MQVPYLSNFLNHLKSAKLDDVCDRAHYLYTPAMLVFFALLIGSKQTFGDPITCIVPAEFPGTWGHYAHQYCFVTGTYHTVNGTDVDADRPKISVDYYQWVPYFLALMAVLFYAPHFLWMTLQKNAEVDYESVVERCSKVRSKSQKERKEEIREVAIYLKDASNVRHRAGIVSSLGWMGTACYLFSKFLNVMNAFIQLQILNKFIGLGSNDWGFQILDYGLQGLYWEATGFFPRVSYCDVSITRLGSPSIHRIQCALMINMLNEKAFVIVYVWLLCLLLPSIANLIYSVFMFTLSFLRFWQARRYLRHALEGEICGANRSYKEYQLLSRFVSDCLSMDGLLMLRFVHTHAGFLVASELATELFHMYREEDALPGLCRQTDRLPGGYSNEAHVSSDLLKVPVYYEKSHIDAPSLTDSLNSSENNINNFPASSKC